MAQKSYALEHLVLFHLNKYGEMGVDELMEDMEHWAEQLKLTSGKYDRLPLYGDLRYALEEAIKHLGVAKQIALSKNGRRLQLTELGKRVAESLSPHPHYFINYSPSESS